MKDLTPHLPALEEVRLELGGGTSLDQAVSLIEESAYDPHYGGLIVANASLQTAVTGALGDLQAYLGQMTGREFTVSSMASSGPSIDLALVEDPRLDEAGLGGFLIQSAGEGLNIFAKDPQGISHGIYYYLELLGCRWLIPNDRWTIIPTRDTIRVDIDQVVIPDYKVRGYAGTGGFYSANWGRNYPQSAVTEKETNNWKRRLRYGAEYELGRHTYQAFLAVPAVTSYVLANPTSLAIVNGVPTPLKTSTGAIDAQAKLNAMHPGIVNMFATWVRDQMAKNRTSSAKHLHRSISCEPSDGYKWGNNTEELVNAGIGNGSPTDQAWYIANACARKVRESFPDGHVVQLAYNQHAPVPSFELESNVIVQVTPNAFQGIPPAKLLADWSLKAPRMAMYDYWQIPDWSWDEPTFNYQANTNALAHYYGLKIEGMQAETTHGAGAMGLGHYIAAHAMWDPLLNADALISEWFALAFGPAEVPMRRMVERWHLSGYMPMSGELGNSYRDINEALTLALNPAVRARVLDYVRYLHYLRLRYELNLAPTTEKAIKLTEYLLDIDGSRMVHGTRIIDLTARGYSGAIQTEFAWTTTTKGPGWARVAELGDEEVERLAVEGATLYPPAAYERKSWGGSLVRLTPSPWVAPSLSSPWGPSIMLFGEIVAEVDIPEGLGVLPFKGTGYENHLTVTRLADSEVVYSEHLINTSASAWERFVPVLPGRHRLSVNINGGRVAGQWFSTWKGVPLVFTSFLTGKQYKSPRLYFYVPKGVTTLAMFYPTTNYKGVLGFRFINADGAHMPYISSDGDTVMLASVAPGQDGRVWSLVNSVSPNWSHVALTVPQAFSLEPTTLMVPEGCL